MNIYAFVSQLSFKNNIIFTFVPMLTSEYTVTFLSLNYCIITLIKKEKAKTEYKT